MGYLLLSQLSVVLNLVPQLRDLRLELRFVKPFVLLCGLHYLLLSDDLLLQLLHHQPVLLVGCLHLADRLRQLFLLLLQFDNFVREPLQLLQQHNLILSDGLLLFLQTIDIRLLTL